MPIAKRVGFERSRREHSLDVSVGVHIFLVVEQSILESQSRGCAKTPILTVFDTVAVQYPSALPPSHNITFAPAVSQTSFSLGIKLAPAPRAMAVCSSTQGHIFCYITVV